MIGRRRGGKNDILVVLGEGGAGGRTHINGNEEEKVRWMRQAEGGTRNEMASGLGGGKKKGQDRTM